MIDDILTNFQTTIEGITPDDMPGTPFRFLDADPEDATRTGASDRRFFIAPDDGLELLDALSASSRIRLRKTIWVVIQYRTGRSLKAFLARVHQDVDRMAYTLSRPTSYPNGTDYALLSRLPAPQFRVDLDDLAQSAVVHVPFECIYSVDYA